MLRRVRILGLLSLLLSGCSVSRNDVVGKYHLNNRPNTSATLEIKADGTYVQHIQIKGQPSLSAQGKWDFEKGSDNPLHLHDAYFFVDTGDEHKSIKGEERFPIERAGGWLVLVVDSDSGIGYMKE